jgi:dTMP kinase
VKRTVKRTVKRRRIAPGIFITFEGIEGSGKSTQIRLLADRLRASDRSVLAVREPGGTELGESLREILLAVGGEGIDPRAELFLYLASRAQLVARVIRPALASGTIVLADRFGDASVAYQGGGRQLGAADVGRLVAFATEGLVPVRTYLLDLSPEISLARVHSRGAVDRLEAERLPFHRRVRAPYRAIARAEPERVRMLDGGRPAEDIAERIGRDVAALLAPRTRRV